MTLTNIHSPLTTDLPVLALANTGVGLRSPHFEDVLKHKPDVGFLEVHSENFLNFGGIPFEYLDEIAKNYVLSFHSVGLSLGSADGLSKTHLGKIKKLLDYFKPALVSEHLSWSGLHGAVVPDLLPLPLTEQALSVISDNIKHVQDVFGRQILIENPSAYMAFKEESMTEPLFLAKLVEHTGCGLLLDINNIHVSGHNQGFDTYHYIDEFPGEHVQEIHLAGYHINKVKGEDFLIDAHNNPVYPEVWQLYDYTLNAFGDRPTLIEWDSDIPMLNTLVTEAKTADTHRRRFRKKAEVSHG